MRDNTLSDADVLLAALIEEGNHKLITTKAVVSGAFAQTYFDEYEVQLSDVSTPSLKAALRADGLRG